MRKKSITSVGLAAAFLALAPMVQIGPGGTTLQYAPAQASEVKIIVNDEVVTSYDIARRSAFMRLQRRSGNLRQMAVEELTEDAIKRDAVNRAGFRIPDSSVDRAFANFASDNRLSTGQLNQILQQSGVTTKHFKEYIRLQIGWGQYVQRRSQSESALMTEQDVVAKMLERGGQKPTSTEYILQQVIFVVPEGQRRSQLAKRRSEANNMRGRVNSCEETKSIAAQVRDVAVRDLGRVLELQLPERWADDVSGLQTGQKTRIKDTERGVEFLVVCRARTVSDDRVAQLEFSTEQLQGGGGGAGEEILNELRANAKISNR